jgi:hypothetical protein
MPYTAIDMINNGLGKFSSSAINSITPPKSSLERRCASYPQWKESELSKRRWVFARNEAYDLPQVPKGAGDLNVKEFKYSLPPAVLKPVRDKYANWSQAGRYIYSNTDDLTIPVILNILEAEFDPLFVDVLACRVWMETVNFVTQTDSSLDLAQAAYREAVAVAGQQNAYVIGPEDVNDDDSAYDFITGRL